MSYSALQKKKKKACWKGWEKRGTKMKGGRRVNNCVKKGEPKNKK